jgi:hypothetical protein
MQSAELKDVIPILDVRDVEAALRFYVERLGFQVDFRYEEDPNNYAGVRRGDVYLHMQWQHEDHFRDGAAGGCLITRWVNRRVESVCCPIIRSPRREPLRMGKRGRRCRTQRSCRWEPSATSTTTHEQATPGAKSHAPATRGSLL